MESEEDTSQTQSKLQVLLSRLLNILMAIYSDVVLNRYFYKEIKHLAELYFGLLVFPLAPPKFQEVPLSNNTL